VKGTPITIERAENGDYPALGVSAKMGALKVDNELVAEIVKS
jgi:hypothetical protein